MQAIENPDINNGGASTTASTQLPRPLTSEVLGGAEGLLNQMIIAYTIPHAIGISDLVKLFFTALFAPFSMPRAIYTLTPWALTTSAIIRCNQRLQFIQNTTGKPSSATPTAPTRIQIFRTHFGVRCSGRARAARPRPHPQSLPFRSATGMERLGVRLLHARRRRPPLAGRQTHGLAGVPALCGGQVCAGCGQRR